MARTELKLLGVAALWAASLCGAPAHAQEAAPEAAAAPLCAAATSYKQCKAACREQFPPKVKVETRDEAADRGRLKVHGWWSLGAGVALLIGGGVTGGVALHLNADLAKACTGGSCPPDRHADLDTRDRLGVTSTVLIAGGVGATAVGILILAVFSRPPDNAEGATGAPAAALLPSFGPNVAGATLAWRF